MKFLVQSAIFAFGLLSTTTSSSPEAIEVPPVSQMVPRGEGAGEKLNSAMTLADAANLGASVITYLINNYRLDATTEQAIRAAGVDALKMLEDTGAEGILFEAEYVKDKFQTDGPPNLTVRLLGERLLLIGAGQNPVDVLAISLKNTATSKSVKQAPSEKQEYVRGGQRNFWITKGSQGSVTIAEISNERLHRSARDIVLNEGLSMQVSAAAYRHSLSTMIEAAERTAATKEAKEAAARLRGDRVQALKKLEEIDSELRRELEKAKEANRDADVFAIGAGLAGAGSSILQASSSRTNSKQIDGSTAELKLRQTPSGNVIQMLQHRVTVEGEVLKSDVQVGAFLQQNGKIVYVPLRKP
ncbi:hypothetical protein [Rhizobium ruizarguesonis]|uniref:hypothetical protein n=1 Tax=Rhizobium ruizarguesonis TaxID=2081791 RepID=UPI001445811E|nr:hypothetical protein [Rhizobium ruizarguesonis]NKQ88714.1 hypothetical protein [Rhizobium ruizarguesonis]